MQARFQGALSRPSSHLRARNIFYGLRDISGMLSIPWGIGAQHHVTRLVYPLYDLMGSSCSFCFKTRCPTLRITGIMKNNVSEFSPSYLLSGNSDEMGVREETCLLRFLSTKYSNVLHIRQEVFQSGTMETSKIYGRLWWLVASCIVRLHELWYKPWRVYGNATLG